MEEVYNLHQHTYCVIILLAKDNVYIKIHDNLTRRLSWEIFYLKEKDCVIYNRQKTKILSWGNDTIEKQDNENDIRITGFMDELYHAFKKDKNVWDEDDSFLVKAVSDFLNLATKKAIDNPKIKSKSFDLFHYIVVVPSEWEEEIRDDLIRPIFIQANLISKNDHKDRLLFISDVESICYSRSNLFTREQNTIICRYTPIEPNTALIKFDLIKTSNALFDIPVSMLFPKVIRSDSFSITSDYIKDCIKMFLTDNLFPYTRNTDQEEIIESIKEIIYNRNMVDEYNLMKPFLKSTAIWKLNQSQRTFLKSMRPIDICIIIGKKRFNSIKNILLDGTIKKYKLLVCKDLYSSEMVLEQPLIEWIGYMLEYKLHVLKNITRLPLNHNRIDQYNIILGARAAMEEAIQNSDLHSLPSIIPADKLEATSSVFIDSKPETIVNINMTLNFTLLSCILLNDNGSVKETFDHDYLIADVNLPSLGNFYDIADVATLKVKEQFILFNDLYLSKELNDLFVDKNFLRDIEIIISCKDMSENEKLIHVHQSSYFRAFLLIYLIYIKEIISNKLSNQIQFQTADIKIGYAISIEKIILDDIIGSKETLRELIYTSGLIKRNDTNKKLRIITEGEEVLSIIQQSLKLDLPVKSYFVLAQLHESYIHLTLNQVLTASKLEDKQQEAIIIEDKIISIQNIYESLSSSMYMSLIQDSSLVQLCNIHNTCNNEDGVSELFSLETRREFSRNFIQYISNKIFNINSKSENFNGVAIKLKKLCNCQVYLSVNDIIEISFRPFLKNITHTMLASLINNKLFGKYRNIKYHISLIYFNHNPRFQKIFADILTEESENYNPTRGIEITCMVLQELQIKMSQSVSKLHLFWYKAFTLGTLNQIYNDNYAFTIFRKIHECRSNLIYKKKITDRESIETSFKIAFPLSNKGNIMQYELNNTFYLDCLNDSLSVLNIDFYRYKSSDILRNNGTTLIKKDIWKEIHGFNFSLNQSSSTKASSTPIMITIKSLGFSASIQISVKLIGEDIDEDNVTEIGNPMTLSRY